jgi:two-component system, OmpR family, sensor histidine kinase QseC
MKLIHNIAVRLSVALLPVIGLWAMVFYFVIVDEINDEADDLLESYAEQLMVRKLSGKELPVTNIMTDGHYSISQVTESYADSQAGMEYYDSDFYISETDENEPARFLKTIFRDREGRCFELIVATPTFEKNDLIGTILWWILALYLILLLTVLR